MPVHLSGHRVPGTREERTVQGDEGCRHGGQEHEEGEEPMHAESMVRWMAGRQMEG